MQNLTALVLDPDTCLKRDLTESQIRNITLRRATSAEQLSASLIKGPADLIMLDMLLPQGVRGLVLVAELRKQKPDIPVILLTAKPPSEDDWISAASEPFVEVVQTPVTAGKLMYHLSRLFQRKDQFADFKKHEVIVRPVEGLRNDNGRLDAELIAKAFDLNISDIAANVNISRQALSKTPDSLNIQPTLRHFERIARSLLAVTGSPKGLKMWLHSPNKRFDEHTPLEIIKLGKVQMLADWVDDGRLGSPD
jgi:DNA-binding response OmpR family regulator